MRLLGIAVANNTAGCLKSVDCCEVQGGGLADTLDLILLNFAQLPNCEKPHLEFDAKEGPSDTFKNHRLFDSEDRST